jgi:Type VI secretion system, TssO
MQTPINTAERNSAFWKFLFFFVLTVAMIITAIFFNTKLPFAENKILQEKAESARNLALSQERFNKSIKEVLVLLDSMDKPQANLVIIKNEVESKLSKLNNIYMGDMSAQAGLDKTIITLLGSYCIKNSNSKVLGDEALKLSEAQSNNVRLAKKVEDLERDLDYYRIRSKQP